MKLLDAVSRSLIALIFIVSGFSKLLDFQSTVVISGSAGLPAPEAAVGVAVAVEIAAGVALAIGLRTRWAALALFVFLIPATALFHAAALADPSQRQMQIVHVMKNLAIMGGLLKVWVDSARVRGAAAGAVPEAVDYPRRRAS